MSVHPLAALIAAADAAINREDFDTLMALYADDAVLVIEPGRHARGKAEIRKAFEAIAAYFRHGLEVEQAGLRILESDDTALVLAKTRVLPPNAPPIHRDATYVFKRGPGGSWLCVIDNSYGHEIFSHAQG